MLAVEKNKKTLFGMIGVNGPSTIDIDACVKNYC